MDELTAYKTLKKPSTEILFKEKKSKFYGYAFPIADVSEVQPIIDILQKKHSSANHVCYAWQIGVGDIQYRANDDGEPSNSAGMPIYRQIQSFEVTNVLVAVARVFGGTKLGVGGLITAYKTAAQLALEAAVIITKKIKVHYTIDFTYAEMNVVMSAVKQLQLEIVSQDFNVKSTMTIAVPKAKTKALLTYFKPHHTTALKKT